MALIILVMLLGLTVFSYFIGKRNLLSPWFLLCFMFSATFIVVILNYNKWDVKINALFMLYVFTAICAFGLGCKVSNLAGKKKGVLLTDFISADEEKIIKTRYPVNIFLIMSVFFSSVYILKLLIDAGDADSFSGLLRNIYENKEYSPGFIYNQLREIVTAIGYLNVFRLLVRIYYKEDKISIFKLIVPVVMLILVMLVSTERNFFLRFAIYSICMWILVYYESHKKNVNRKIFIRGVFILAIFVLIFFSFGKAKQYTSSFLNQISIYSGSGLYDFNLWISEFKGPYLYGQSTFTQLIGTIGVFLRFFGIELSGNVSLYDQFISFETSSGYFYNSNIYTSLRPFVEDFGYLGVIFFPFVIGLFFQWLFNKTRRSKFGLSWVIYALLLYPIIYFPISEQFFRRFHLGFIYEIVWLALLYYLIFLRKKKNVRICSMKKAKGVRVEKRQF